MPDNPPKYVEPPPPRANLVQGTSIALGITGLAMTAAGATQSTTESFLQLGHDAVVQTGMFFGFATVPGSLRWGIVLTGVSLVLNIYSFWLHSQYQSKVYRALAEVEAEKATRASAG